MRLCYYLSWYFSLWTMWMWKVYDFLLVRQNCRINIILVHFSLFYYILNVWCVFQKNFVYFCVLLLLLLYCWYICCYSWYLLVLYFLLLFVKIPAQILLMRQHYLCVVPLLCVLMAEQTKEGRSLYFTWQTVYKTELKHKAKWRMPELRSFIKPIFIFCTEIWHFVDP